MIPYFFCFYFLNNFKISFIANGIKDTSITTIQSYKSKGVTLNILAIKLIEIIITWRKIPSKIEYTKYLLENIPKENADLVLLLRDSDKNNWDTLSTTKAIVWAWIKESA